MPFERYVYPPYAEPLLEAYDKAFESTYILLHPFVRVPEALSWRACRQYPTDTQIFAHGAKCRWAEVARAAGIRNGAQMSQALLTTIGAIDPFLADPAARDALAGYLQTNLVWMPTEGRFEPLLHADLLAPFAAAGFSEIVHVPEFPAEEPVTRLALADLEQGKKKFPERGSLVAPDESFLWTVDWDSFFCLFYGPRKLIENTARQRHLEGFFAEPETEHLWFNWKMGCATCTVSPDGWSN